MKELTIAEAKEILRAVEQQTPHPEKLEIIAAAYKSGYAAAKAELKREG